MVLVGEPIETQGRDLESIVKPTKLWHDCGRRAAKPIPGTPTRSRVTVSLTIFEVSRRRIDTDLITRLHKQGELGHECRSSYAPLLSRPHSQYRRDCRARRYPLRKRQIGEFDARDDDCIKQQ